MPSLNKFDIRILLQSDWQIVYYNHNLPHRTPALSNIVLNWNQRQDPSCSLAQTTLYRKEITIICVALNILHGYPFNSFKSSWNPSNYCGGGEDLHNRFFRFECTFNERFAGISAILIVFIAPYSPRFSPIWLLIPICTSKTSFIQNMRQ